MTLARVARAGHESGPERLKQARFHSARGDLSLALESVAPLLEDPRLRPEALLLKGEVLMQMRELDDAHEAFVRAAREAPTSCAALNGLARCLHALGHDDEAVEVALRAWTLLDRGDAHRHGAAVALTLLWCLREQRRYREALDFAEQGLGRWPDAVLAQWASVVEEELAEAERERC